MGVQTPSLVQRVANKGSNRPWSHFLPIGEKGVGFGSIVHVDETDRKVSLEAVTVTKKIRGICVVNLRIGSNGVAIYVKNVLETHHV